MRRKDKEITDREAIDEIILQCRVCRLGMADESEPYVIPMCFGYDGSAIYFHGAKAGKKIDVLRKNPRVCVEFDLAGNVIEADQACAWSMNYQSVVAFGEVTFVEDMEEKRNGLRCIMDQYAGPDRPFPFPDNAVAHTVVLKVKIDRITGKQSD